jgi:hypothetical protein
MIIALIIRFFLPGLPVWSVLLVMAVSFMALFSLYVLFLGLVELLVQFRRLLFRPPPPQTRMTKEEVMGLAAEAFAKTRIDEVLLWPTVRSIDGRLTWIVGTATVGSGCTVSIDDATGEVGPVEYWGVR